MQHEWFYLNTPLCNFSKILYNLMLMHLLLRRALAPEVVSFARHFLQTINKLVCKWPKRKWKSEIAEKKKKEKSEEDWVII